VTRTVYKISEIKTAACTNHNMISDRNPTSSFLLIDRDLLQIKNSDQFKTIRAGYVFSTAQRNIGYFQEKFNNR